MRKPFWIIAIVLVGAILIGSAWLAVAAPPPPIEDQVYSMRLPMAPPTPILIVPMPSNLLANPSFEGDYVYWGGSTNAAPDWTPWSAPGDPPPCIAGQPGCYIPCPSNCENCQRDYGCWWAEAEHKAASLDHPERVHTGEKAQQAFTYGRMGEFGVYQAVTVPVGAALRFSVYAQGWQGAEPDKMNLRIGIGAQGETNPYSDTIVWSTPVESFDHYSLISVTAAAQNDVVTVWTYARPQWDWARDHNDAYWDDAALMVVTPSTAYMTAQPASAWLSQTVTVQVSTSYDYPSQTLTVTTPAGGNIPPSDKGITHTDDLYIHTWSFASEVTGTHHITFNADQLQEPVTASVNIVSVAAVKVSDCTPPLGAPVTLYMWAYYPYTNVLLTINHPDGTLFLSTSPTQTGGAPFRWPWTFTPTITGTYPFTFTAARLDAPVHGLIFAGRHEIYLPIILKNNQV